MKKKLLIIFVFILTICATAFGTTANVIESLIIDIPIYYKGKLMEINYPLLAYDGHVYVAVRDMANAMDRNVIWGADYDDDDNIISGVTDIMLGQKKDNYPISENMAFSIGKAIIDEAYSEQINENTMYLTLFEQAVSFHVDNRYSVYAIFNLENKAVLEEDDYYIANKYDVCVNIDPYTGAFEIKESPKKQ